MIFKNSAILAFFSIAALLLGILRDRLLAQYVGVGPMLDVYNASFRIPDLALGLMLSFASATTVVPFLMKEFKQDKVKELQDKFTSLFFFFSTIMVIALTTIIITIPLYAHFIVPGFTEAQLSQFIFFTRLLAIQPILLGISALIACLGQLRNEFYFYGIAPLIYTIIIILSIVFAYPLFGLMGIISGVVLGAFAHSVFQSLTLLRIPFSVLKGNFSMSYIKEHLSIAVPRSGSFVISNLRIVFFTGFATTLGPGVLSIYIFAQKISDAFIQVLAQSIATASLPNLSSSYAEGNFLLYKQIVKKYTLLIMAAAAVATAAAVLFGDKIVFILYGATNMNPAIASMFVLLALALPLHTMNFYLTHAFSAMKDTRKIFIANAVATVVGIIASLLARHQGYGSVSIPIGLGALSVVMSALLLLFYYTKKHESINNQI